MIRIPYSLCPRQQENDGPTSLHYPIMLSSRRQLAVLVLVQPDFELASSRRTCAGARENRACPAINSARLNLTRSVTLLQFSLFNRFSAAENLSELAKRVQCPGEIAVTPRLPAEQQVFVIRSRLGPVRFVGIRPPVACILCTHVDLLRANTRFILTH